MKQLVLWTLVASGLLFWLAALGCYLLDASPLDNFDLHLSWVRSGDKTHYRGQLEGQPVPRAVEGWPSRPIR